MTTSINPAHWDVFLLFLRTAARDTEISFALDTIRDVIWTQRSGTYDDRQPSVVCSALADPDLLDRATESGFILVACSAGYPQASRQSFGAPSLALKVLEMPKEEGAGRTFPFAYDLFADGRHVLELPGLRLDTEARLSRYKVGTIGNDLMAMSTAVPEYLRLITWLVESFPDRSDHRTTGPKKWALEDLLSA
ncbi:MAG: hypothetical protein WCO25_01770 [Candidatus Uhrbacteria bacterium]